MHCDQKGEYGVSGVERLERSFVRLCLHLQNSLTEAYLCSKTDEFTFVILWPPSLGPARGWCMKIGGRRTFEIEKQALCVGQRSLKES